MSTYGKELQQQLQQLQDGMDAKEAEIALLENELIDLNTPNCLLLEMAKLLLSMVSEQAEFVKKNGMNPRVMSSQQRVLRLLEIRKCLEGISTSNYNLKATNRLLHAKNQILRLDNHKLKQQIEQITHAEAF